MDEKNNSVLLPINGSMIPFHICTIKNVTKHSEKKFMSMRFNFNCPPNGNLNFPSIQSLGKTPIFVKELTFRSTNIDSFFKIQKKINELQKKFKIQLNQNNNIYASNKNQILKEKLKYLPDLSIRPPLSGRKSVGSLTAYTNGFKFISKKQQALTIMLSNIKQAIFQPCDENMVIIIHFVLKCPILINKKLQTHIPFYREVGFGADDLNDHKRNYDYGDEEIREERIKN